MDKDKIKSLKDNISRSEQRAAEYRRKLVIYKQDLKYELERQKMFLEQLEELESK